MATEHRLIPDAERHEPKGISTALVGQVYRADGSAAGAWKNDIITLNAIIPDISTNSSILVPIPANCIVVSIKSVLSGAITVADANITITRGGDSATVVSYVVPYAGSAEGVTVDASPSGNETLIANTHNYLKIATDGGSTDAAALSVAVKVKVIE